MCAGRRVAHGRILYGTGKAPVPLRRPRRRLRARIRRVRPSGSSRLRRCGEGGPVGVLGTGRGEDRRQRGRDGRMGGSIQDVPPWIVRGGLLRQVRGQGGRTDRGGISLPVRTGRERHGLMEGASARDAGNPCGQKDLPLRPDEERTPRLRPDGRAHPRRSEELGASVTDSLRRLSSG